MLAAKVCRRVANRSLFRRSFCLAGLRVGIVVDSGLNRLFPSIFYSNLRSFSTENEVILKQIGENYQKLTQREHILKRPDSYSEKSS